MKKIFMVLFASFAVSVASKIVLMVASMPFGKLSEMAEILFGEWLAISTLLIMLVSYPLIWKHMKS